MTFNLSNLTSSSRTTRKVQKKRRRRRKKDFAVPLFSVSFFSSLLRVVPLLSHSCKRDTAYSRLFGLLVVIGRGDCVDLESGNKSRSRRHGKGRRKTRARGREMMGIHCTTAYPAGDNPRPDRRHLRDGKKTEKEKRKVDPRSRSVCAMQPGKSLGCRVQKRRDLCLLARSLARLLA